MRSTKGRPFERCLAIAEAQHGVIDRDQALGAGMSPQAIGRALEGGKLRSLHRGVYLIGGQRPTRRTHLLAAAKAAGEGAFVSHRSAAELWDLLPPIQEPVHVTCLRRLRGDGLVAHRASLSRDQVTTKDAIPVTSPHRTLIDLGDVVTDDVVEDALDVALNRRITSVAWLQKQLACTGTKGRKGATTLRELLDVGLAKPPSWLERRFIRLLKAATLPSYSREFEVGGFRLDFAWPEALLGVEVHGAKWHQKRERWAKDLRRHNLLTAWGWTVLHFTWEEIRDTPGVVIEKIVATYVRSSRRLDVSSR